MTKSVNKIILVGTLLQDPEILRPSNEAKLCNFKVATAATWKGRFANEDDHLIEVHSIVIRSSRHILLAEDRLQKGATVYIEGQMESRLALDHSGIKRRTTEIILRSGRSRLLILNRYLPLSKQPKNAAEISKQAAQVGLTPEVSPLD